MLSFLSNLKRILTFCLAFAIGTAMGQSALVGLASKGSVSLINNGFDLGKVAGDLTSKESLKGLGLNMATAGLTAGIGHGLGLESIAPGMDMAGRAKILAQQGLISGAVRTGLAGATGENVGQAWKDEALSMGLALGQSKIGDIAQDSALKTGSIGKVALHAGAGSLYSLATGSTALSGAIGGATGEIVAGVMESGSGLNGPPSDVPLTKEQTQLFEQEIHNDLIPKVKAVSKLTSAAVTLAIGGNAKDISTASGVAESSITYNFGPHPSFNQEIEQQKQELLVEAGEVIKEHPDEFLTAVDIITFANPLAKAGELAITGGIRGIKGIAQWASTKGTAKLAEKTNSGAGKSVVFKKGKPRGVNNPKTKERQNIGVQVHKKLDKKLELKRTQGWKKGYRMEDPKTGKMVIPDGLTPSGRPIELKPFTPSGIKKGKSQLPKYERATGKKGRVIYYDPNNPF